MRHYLIENGCAILTQQHCVDKQTNGP